MEDFVKRMVSEHANLCIKIDALENYVYSKESDKDDKYEYANKCVQLSAMQIYEKALRARLMNQGVFISEEGEYLEKVASITDENVEPCNDNLKSEEESNEPVFD